MSRKIFRTRSRFEGIRLIGKGLIAVGLLVVLLGGSGFLILSGGSTDSPAQAASPATSVAKMEMPIQVMATNVKSDVSGVGHEARKIIGDLRKKKGSINLDAMFKTAEQFSDKGKLADAQLLYFFSASRGHAWSAFTLGTMYDPWYQSVLPNIMDKPDLYQAYKWYRIAADNGNEDAIKYLIDLKKQVEQTASEGSPDAQRVLLLWK